MIGPKWKCLGRVAGLAFAMTLTALQAHALVIDTAFEGTLTSATGASQTQIEATIENAATAVASLYGNSGTVSILFTTQPGSFLGESVTDPDLLPYSTYTQLLTADASANPSNTTLATAVAHLGSGNDANGAKLIAATSALLRVGLGDSAYTAGFSQSSACSYLTGSTGCAISGYQGPYDGIIELSTSQPLDYTNRDPTGSQYDATRAIEHEIDEVLGGGGQGSTLNSVYAGGFFGNYMGPLDLYRYACGSTTPSFTTSSSADACLSVDGGATDIVQFNQSSSGDYADYASGSSGCPDCEFPATSGCPDYVQDAFSCTGQAANVSTTSPEYKMMEALGFDPVVPEPRSIALFGVGLGGVAALRRRRARRTGGPTTPAAVATSPRMGAITA
jgi:hypothetical protein